MSFEPPSGLSRRAVLAATAIVPLAGQEARASAAAPDSARSHYDRAARLAGDDPILRNIVKALSPGAVPPSPDPVEPLRIFDDVAVVTTGFVSVTAILTSEGVILIDALGSPEEAEKVLVPGLRAVGVNPAEIRYVVAAHGHDDHFGGARHLAERYGAKVMMNRADWNLAASSSPAPGSYLDISDGQRLTLGGTTVVFHRTPGHTPGTVSAIFPVRWRGRRHTAMLWGGTNPPAGTAGKRDLLSSVRKFASCMRRAGVDVELNNHGACDQGLVRMERLRAGSADPENPFVIGPSRAQRFMDVMEEMLRGRIATDRATGHA